MTVGPPRPQRGCRSAFGRSWPVAVFALLAACTALLCAVPASAQLLSFPQRPKPPERHGPANGQMLVQANEIQYDYNNDRVSAVGNVQIYYNGSVLEADKVIYDEKTKHLHAEGNAVLTEANGQVTRGQVIDLSDDYRNGFVESLRVDLPDQSHIAATRADRTKGQYTVFQNGVYTACEPCKDHPEKPPKWQVKAARIIHNQTEHMIYFEDARLEMFGYPIAYFPYLSTPDPTVKRKTGWLEPIMGSSSRVGYTFGAPFFWALAPDYDLTLTPMITSRQGPLLETEFRQRLVNGSYYIRGAGIFQQDPNAFAFPNGGAEPGYGKDFRGTFETAGQFSLNDKWVWGWDGILPSDNYFYRDYRIATPWQSKDLLQTTPTEGISDLYLSGRGERSYFDARSIYFYGFSALDAQSQIPVVHPVIDYSYVFGKPILGGELSYNTNLTSLSRQNAEFDAVNLNAAASGGCAQVANPNIKTPPNCLLRGVPGSYSRFSAEVNWRRSIVDPIGEIFTPFASLRADAANVAISNQPGVSNYFPTGDYSEVRAMPTVGVEYRYPFIGVESWGTQTIEPIAQVIVRPNETKIGRFPNEDSQSLIFDDTNLFKIDKFAGYDRVEGGGRANVGVLYTAQVNQAGYFDALFGQSYQLFGVNSFATPDQTNTGLDSGLDTDRSDYVARASYRPNRLFSFVSRFRFDHDNMAMKRLELEGSTTLDRWNLSVTYGNYAPQPELGFLQRREGIAATTRYKLTDNWNLLASTQYDLDAGKISGTSLGIGYIDDCLIVAVNYMTNYNYVGGEQVDHLVMLQIALRTLGSAGGSQTVSNSTP